MRNCHWKVADPWPPRLELSRDDGKVVFPRVWVTYKQHKSYKEDFDDLISHGVAGIEVRQERSEWPEILRLARQKGIKLSTSIPEITENRSLVEKHGYKPTAAIMIGGAYKGLAIDRHLFSFSPRHYSILIEEPVYDKENCYGALGRYFPRMGPPIRAEVVVPKRNYDGRQHLTILPAQIRPADREHFYRMSFDLSPVEGDLSRVGLAVYWEYEGTDKYWMFSRGPVSAWAESTRLALQEEVRELVAAWREANGGTFPGAEVLMARYGDECFYPTGHLNAPEASYPLWDYSQPAIEEYRKRCRDEYPRTWGFPEIYGPKAYAAWMYTLHKGCAELVGCIKDTLTREDVPLLVFRNMTRAGVFSIANYRDGTGLQMLTESLDIAHLDPYPCHGPKDYREKTIPRDMGYVCGLARPLKRAVMPWLQAHAYLAERGGLDHPTPKQIQRMVEQHMPFHPLALIWLGYPGSFQVDPENWKMAARMHKRLGELPTKPPEAEVAVVRPYEAWSLVGLSHLQTVDRLLTDAVIEWLQFEAHAAYDAFEPYTLADIAPGQLEQYRLVFAPFPILAIKEGLTALKASGASRLVLFCETGTALEEAGSAAGVRSVLPLPTGGQITGDAGRPLKAEPLAGVELTAEARELAQYAGKTVIWEHENTVIASVRPDPSLDAKFLWWLWKQATSPQR